jgi:hypothetical protein
MISIFFVKIKSAEYVNSFLKKVSPESQLRQIKKSKIQKALPEIALELRSSYLFDQKSLSSMPED